MVAAGHRKVAAVVAEQNLPHLATEDLTPLNNYESS
jgi:hypothetical protein